MSAFTPQSDIGGAIVLSAKDRTSLWQQLVRKILHAAGHRYLDGGNKAPGRAWLGRDHLDPDNEDGRHDKGNGQRMAHGDVPSVTDM